MKPILACVLALGLLGCKKDTKTEGKSDPAPASAGSAAPAASADPSAAPSAAPAASADPSAAPAPAAPAAPTAGGGADNSDPAKVVEQIFAAASSGKADALAGLCDPAGTGDGDVKSICAMKAGDPTWERFVRDFSKGKVDGAPTVEGDSATVSFLFGRDGTKKESMNLSRIGGKWYLGSF